MRQILGYLKTQVQEDFDLRWYSLNLLFLLIAFYFNFQYNLTYHWLDSRFGNPWLPLLFLPYFMLPFFFTVFSYAILFKDYHWLKSRKFWGYSLFILCVLSLNSGASFHRVWIKTLVPFDLVYIAEMIAINLGSFLLFLIPIFLFKILFDRKRKDLYGITRNNYHPQPYLWMLLIMAPLIAWASFQSDFLAVYPTYRSSGVAEEYLGLSHWITHGIYELFYLADFATVELLFRGFMVIGLTSIMGRKAILPMVTTYAFLHFGKPLGEAIGSIFGGYILGVIAYESRNIWGGVFIHGGVAFLMDVAALIQVYWLQATQHIKS